MSKAKPIDCVPVDSQDPLYILYTSGTTGQPKGVLRSNGGHAVALTWSMKALYGLDPGEVGRSWITFNFLLFVSHVTPDSIELVN